MAASLPVVLSYCATFLKPEMVHVYRQVTGLQEFEQWVVTRRLSHPERFPFPRVVALKKPLSRIIRRAWYRVRGLPVPLSPSETRQMLDLAKGLDARVVHVYFGTEAARLIDYLRREQRPKVVSFHGADLSASLSREEFEALLGCVDLFFARSESLRAALLERGCPPERIHLNPTGVTVPEVFTPRELPVFNGERPLRLLQACRFIEKKGLDVTLEAVGVLRDGGVPVTLDLAGAGPEEVSLRTQAERLGLGNQVRFLGFLGYRELQQRMPEYDLFVHPSRQTGRGDREGIPNALLEAMAMGVPGVATRHSGIPEAVAHGENGALIDHAEPMALAAAIRELIGDGERYRACSLGAHETVRERFSVASCIRILEEGYRVAMERAKARGV